MNDGKAAPSGTCSTLSTKEAATYIGLSASLLEKLRLQGTGPVFCRLGERVVRYRHADLDAWVNARVATSTSQQRAYA